MLSLLLLSLRINFTGKPEQLRLSTGTYIIKMWGAKGGDSSKGAKGGLGAYVETVMTLKESIDMVAYIGGTNAHNNPGYNGGGWGKWCGENYGGGGGGATDLRISDRISGRIIVAAGGSGASGNSEGNPGGDLNGINKGHSNGNVDQKLGNQNGVGDSTKDFISNCQKPCPLSGGGGGYRGGLLAIEDKSECPYYESHQVSSSGSSFVYTYPGANDFKPEGWKEGIKFYIPGTKIQSGSKPVQLPEGGEASNGLLIIQRIDYFQKEFDCKAEETPFRTFSDSFVDKVKKLFFHRE